MGENIANKTTDKRLTFKIHKQFLQLTLRKIDNPTKKPFRTNTQKRCPFHYRALECKSRKSRIPGITANLALEYRMKQNKG